MKDFPKGKILIVDDIKADINILKSGLEDEYNVSVSYDGKSAIAKAIKEPPDLILLDILMPEMNGYEVLKHFKENDITKNNIKFANKKK